jgi:hypothetical protein
MCLSGRGLVEGIYVPFWYRACGRQLFAFLVLVSGTRECDAVLWPIYFSELKCFFVSGLVVGS